MEITTSTGEVGPIKVLLYGEEGIGKTTLASTAPKPIFMLAEKGLGMLKVDHSPPITTYGEMMDGLLWLVENEHEYETVVVDSLTSLEPMIWDHICETVPHEKGHKVDRIEDYGFSKGYNHALDLWREFLSLLDELHENLGMHVVLIGHHEIKRFESPTHDPYDQFVPRLNKHARATCVGWCDTVLFASQMIDTVTKEGDFGKKRTMAKGQGKRILFTEKCPNYVAKNRFNLPPQIPMEWDAIWDNMVPF